MLNIDGTLLSPRLIILDKDGTLVAFDRMWHTWFDLYYGHISERCNLAPRTRLALATVLGYDRVERDDWDPLGPLTIASTGEVVLLTAGQLYGYEQLPWDEALALAQEAEEHARTAVEEGSLLAAIGDARGWLGRLVEAGYILALATTDTRASTDRHLQALGLAECFRSMVCGDDGIPLKPAPDMALALCERLEIAPAEAIMIGDSVGDMVMARRAGLAAVIGVASGAMPACQLAEYADQVIPDIHAIEIVD